MKSEKELKKIANSIYQLELNIQANKDVESSKTEIEKIANTLGLDDFFWIDDYLMTKRFQKF